MSSLTLEAITKSFDRIQALSRVDLSVRDGEFCVLLGPSGCGKSTLLNIIAGLIPQDGGCVKLDGSAIDRLSPRDRDVAMVFQSYALYPHMTVAENLSFGLRMRKVPKARIRKRVAEAAGVLGIETLLDRKPRQLSGGQRQRVAMGRALVRRPRIFLMDEPLSNLDARLRASVRLELKQLHRTLKSTVVYVTHDQVEAMTLGDRVVVMKDGLIRQMGTPETIYGRPEDVFVAQFIGTPEINLFQGKIFARNGVCGFQGNGFFIELGTLPLPERAFNAQLAVRPEDVTLETEGAPSLETTLEMISHVGSEKYLHVRLAGEPLTLRVPKERHFEHGQTIPVHIHPAGVHVFRDGRRVQVLDRAGAPSGA